MLKPNPAEFRTKALAHYQGKLASEKARFGVKAISEGFVEHNSRVLIESGLWDDLAKQIGLKMIVSWPDGDPQTVYVIMSDREIQQPGGLYELWRVVTDLMFETDQDEHERLREDIESLDLYNGPYGMDVPEAILDAVGD